MRDVGIFLLKISLAYASWKLISWLIPKIGWLENSWNALADLFAYLLGNSSAFLLSLLTGKTVDQDYRTILLEGTPGVYLADHCLALSSSFVFTLFVLVFDGRLQSKLWFIPLGWLIIQIVNCLRIVILSLLQQVSGEAFFSFNHRYTFVVVIYGAIILMSWWWLNREERFARANSAKIA